MVPRAWHGAASSAACAEGEAGGRANKECSYRKGVGASVPKSGETGRRSPQIIKRECPGRVEPKSKAKANLEAIIKASLEARRLAPSDLGTRRQTIDHPNPVPGKYLGSG